MTFDPLTMERGAEATAAELRTLIPPSEAVSGAVAEILSRVRLEGDLALRQLIERYDTEGRPAPPLRASEDELARAERALDPAVAAAMRTAFQNVVEVARSGVTVEPATATDRDGRQVLLREEPLHRAAVYVPGGRAPYPSTVVMGVAAARAAGVGEVVVCSPPRPASEGRAAGVDEVILGACRLTGASEVYRMGGAHAIGALAYGTETVRPVDMIVGPGNAYVQEAKHQVSSSVGIDGFAGPSDLMVIVEHDVSDLEPIALDLLAQAEHGAGTLSIGVSTSTAVLGQLRIRLEGESVSGAVIRLVHAPTSDAALALAEAFAPEHLQLAGAEAEALAPRVTRAGCLFVGPQSGTAFGDYIVGSNHVLPTNGTGRFASGLSALQFRRRFAEV